MSVQEITSEVSTEDQRAGRQLTLMLLPTIFAKRIDTAASSLIRQKQSVDIESHRKRCWVLLFTELKTKQ